ncbi:EamA family transporter [Undibacterium sp. CY7W]|uniref:EamA family transporter n=1 Tax=Undibacterium rugosum TaxID=2762291 RepID=A0A923KWN3_9BURK|nr:EamA family transporter [Undibacterium rugosum]
MKYRHLALALLVTMIWGSNFSVIKWSLTVADPFLLAGLRFLLCAIPAIFFVRRPQVAWTYLLAYGLLFGSFLWGLCNLGIATGLSAGLASLIIQSAVFFSLGLSAWLYREKLHRFQWQGSCMAGAGLCMIIFVSDGTVTFSGIILVMAGALCWALSNFVLKESRTKELLGFLVWSCLFAPIPLLLMSWLSHDMFFLKAQFRAMTPSFWLGLFYQVYIVTLFGYTAWNFLIRQYSVSRVMPLSLLIPVFGLAVSALFFSEPIGYLKLFASALILSGLICNLFGERWWAAWQEKKRLQKQAV